MILKTTILILALVMSVGMDLRPQQSVKTEMGANEIVNLSHLNHLSEHVIIDGQEMLLTRIYAAFPTYEWIEAPGEGIACVDDVTRAVVVYLKHYETFGDRFSLDMARKGLNFVMYMQQPDGEFYNFITRDHTINRTGITSVRSFDWWAARGLWALGYGFRVFSEADQVFAATLEERILWTLVPIEKALERYGEYFPESDGRRAPAWLVADSAGVTSYVVLGLLEYYSVTQNPRIAEIINKFCRGLAGSRFGDFDAFPYGAHLPYARDVRLWHGWGNRQSMALAKAGRLLERKEWIESAQKEADIFFLRLLATRMLREMRPHPRMFPQIAYGISPIVGGFLELYNATGNEDYAIAAGLTASWFMGNNVIKVPMYDPKTGRSFDGIDFAAVNLNSGAESTIEALITLIGVTSNEISGRYLHHIALPSRIIRDELGEIVMQVKIYVSPEGEKLAVVKCFATRAISIVDQISEEMLSKYMLGEEVGRGGL